MAVVMSPAKRLLTVEKVGMEVGDLGLKPE